MYAINPDGSKKWNNTIGNGNDASIVIDCDGTIYTGTSVDGFFAINPSDGSIKWNISYDNMKNVDLNGWCFSINNNTIYCGSSNGLFAINLQGQILWYSQLVGNCLYSTPAFDKTGNIYIGTQIDGLQYVDYKTGIIIETISNGDCSDCSPTIDKSGNIYIGTDTGFYVYYSNRTEKFNLSGNFNYVSPVIDNNEYIYIYNIIDYTISCINIKDNFLVWSYEIGSGVYSTPAIDKNGVLYISYVGVSDYGIVAFGN